MGEWSVSGGESFDRGSGEDLVLGGKRGEREEIQKNDDRGFRGCPNTSIDRSSRRLRAALARCRERRPSLQVRHGVKVRNVPSATPLFSHRRNRRECPTLQQEVLKHKQTFEKKAVCLFGASLDPKVH